MEGAADAEPPPPDFQKAREFQRNIVLPRYEKEVDKKGKVNYRKKEPGELGGHLYGIWSTPLEQLGDFGLGVGLYYHLVVMMTVILVIAGLINSWTIDYFMSPEYDPTGQVGATSIQRGSAICTNLVEVCLDPLCTETAEMRECPLDGIQGMLDYITVFFFLGALTWLSMYQTKRVEIIDVGEQTAQDYSIVVHDPNPDAVDPEEWRQFFTRFGHVTYVTVALNNGELLRHLAVKRNIIHSMKLETGGHGLYERALVSGALQ